MFGTERTHLLGLLDTDAARLAGPDLVVAVVVGRARPKSEPGARAVGGAVLRIARVFAIGLLPLVAQTMFSDGGRPGSLVVTLFYVFAGIVVSTCSVSTSRS